VNSIFVFTARARSPVETPYETRSR